MKSRFHGFADNLVFALNVFIVFLLLFESKITVPYWLQPLGRMHPLLLHFPIVMLMLAMGLEFFRFNNEFKTQDMYQKFTSNILLIGLLSSAVTVIMGLFLAKEEPYTGELVQRHKWSGIGIVFLASFVYLARNKCWYNVKVAKSGAIVILFSLVLAGHYGAALTHGDNFIFEPISGRKDTRVPVDQAIVFDHVIKPVFEKKCATCHNPDKVKGKLILTDAGSVLKGGKTGKLFVAGQPENSLLLKRIHLPMADKKHMPPSGKEQLSENEIALLHYWIKSNPEFKTKVLELPVNDSLRILSAVFLKPAEATEERFDFAAADEKTVHKLNTKYRTVYALSKNSPALSVSFYGKEAYGPTALDELNEVKTQIVSLNLNKMPVADTDWKKISRFENLQKLNLNFTGLTGGRLKELVDLKHLKMLSLAGAKVSFRDLQQLLPRFKSLNKLVIWNTGLKESEIRQLKNSFKGIELITGFKDDGKNPVQLIPPQLKNNTVVFNKPVSLQLAHPINGVNIRYTTDGSEPDSIESPLFNREILLKENTVIKARAFKEGWLSSDLAVFNFYKSAYKPDSVILLSPLNENHKANGTRTFFDGKLGDFNLPRANSDKWAGYVNNDMELLLTFKKGITASSLSLNAMIQPGQNVFPPTVVEIWGGTTETDLQLLSRVKHPVPEKDSKRLLKVIDCSFKPRHVSFIKVKAMSLKKMPDWHRNKGKPSLMLIDEVFIN